MILKKAALFYLGLVPVAALYPHRQQVAPSAEGQPLFQRDLDQHDTPSYPDILEAVVEGSSTQVEAPEHPVASPAKLVSKSAASFQPAKSPALSPEPAAEPETLAAPPLFSKSVPLEPVSPDSEPPVASDPVLDTSHVPESPSNPPGNVWSPPSSLKVGSSPEDPTKDPSEVTPAIVESPASPTYSHYSVFTLQRVPSSSPPEQQVSPVTLSERPSEQLNPLTESQPTKTLKPPSTDSLWTESISEALPIETESPDNIEPFFVSSLPDVSPPPVTPMETETTPVIVPTPASSELTFDNITTEWPIPITSTDWWTTDFPTSSEPDPFSSSTVPYTVTSETTPSPLPTDSTSQETPSSTESSTDTSETTPSPEPISTSSETSESSASPLSTSSPESSSPEPLTSTSTTSSEESSSEAPSTLVSTSSETPSSSEVPPTTSSETPSSSEVPSTTSSEIPSSSEVPISTSSEIPSSSEVPPTTSSEIPSSSEVPISTSSEAPPTSSLTYSTSAPAPETSSELSSNTPPVPISTVSDSSSVEPPVPTPSSETPSSPITTDISSSTPIPTSSTDTNESASVESSESVSTTDATAGPTSGPTATGHDSASATGGLTSDAVTTTNTESSDVSTSTSVSDDSSAVPTSVPDGSVREHTVTDFLPSVLIVQSSSSSSSGATSDEGTSTDSPSRTSSLPTSALPKDIVPSVQPTHQTSSKLVGIGLARELNYEFVATHPLSAAQIMKFLPEGVVYGLEIDSKLCQMKDLRSRHLKDDKKNPWLQTVATFYIPASEYKHFKSLLEDRDSRLYQNPDPAVHSLMGLIVGLVDLNDPSFDSVSDDGHNTYGALGSFDQNAQPMMKVKPNARVAGTILGVVFGTILLLALLVLATRRYRQSIALNEEYAESWHSHRFYDDDSEMMSMSSRQSILPPQPARGNPAAISQPVISSNSLGWA